MQNTLLSSLVGVVVDTTDISMAEVQTKFGLVFANLDDTWFPAITVGASIEIDDGSAYITNGRIITFPGDEIRIDGAVYTQL